MLRYKIWTSMYTGDRLLRIDDILPVKTIAGLIGRSVDRLKDKQAGQLLFIETLNPRHIIS
jgi:hypothetical protein